LPAPFFEPGVLVFVLAVFELVLEPAFELLPACRALLPLGAELIQHRGELVPRWRVALDGGFARLPHELFERAQSVGGYFLAPLAQGIRQQSAPRRARQSGQQVGATLLDTLYADVSARIELHAARFHRAQRRVVGGECTGAHEQTRQREPARHARASRRARSRNFRSW
jgi:hypothetical protein